ncbi:MAG: hypothetical protein ACJ72W_11230 [Actinoallomurus sp.]
MVHARPVAGLVVAARVVRAAGVRAPAEDRDDGDLPARAGFRGGRRATSLMTEVATTGSRPTMRRRFAVLAAALGGAALEAALLTWARPAAPALPLAVALTVVAAMAVRRRRPQ